MLTPKVSVIIPVYGVEKYIERCACSLFEQTLDDIEYIFVDDCTPDRSIDILRQVLADYPHRRDQAKFLSTPVNSGQHIARRIGIEAATGQYITHCDPDDAYARNDALATAYQKAVTENADIVWWDIEVIDNRSGCRLCSQSCNTDKVGLLAKHLSNPTFMGSLCNRLVSKRIVKHSSIIYPRERIIEDLLLVVQYTMQATSFSYVPKALYSYNRNENSSTAYSDVFGTVEKQLKRTLSNATIITDILENSPKLKDVLKDDIFRFKWYVKNKAIPLAAERMTGCKIWRTSFPELNHKFFFSQNLTFKDKIRSVLIWSNLFCLLCRR